MDSGAKLVAYVVINLLCVSTLFSVLLAATRAHQLQAVSESNSTEATLRNLVVTSNYEYDYAPSLIESTSEIEILTPKLPGDERKDDWVWSFTLSWSNILYSVFSLIGIVGNVLVLLALMKHKSSHHPPDIFIGALAFADLLTSIFILPVPRARSVPATVLGDMYCSIVHSRYPMWVCIHASIYTLTGMSLERFMAVVYPLRLHRRLTSKHVFVYLAVIWTLCVPSCFQFLSVRATNNICRDVKPPEQKKIIVFYLFMIRVGVPALTMIITQGLTAISLHRQSREMREARFVKGGTKPSFHVTARNRVVKMTFIVVLIYMFTVGPNMLATLIAVMTETHSSYLFSPLHYSLTYATFINSCANPVIYAARYPKFRVAIREIFSFRLEEKGGPLFAQTIETSQTSSNTGSEIKSNPKDKP
ncbi:allatostatin-A receptor-like [Diadema setosum]|uniref:allatostatin-A receptor-like n=1 Tax=Diadema setosum TaxID=31175 RepID=UPI003B3B90E1